MSIARTFLRAFASGFLGGFAKVAVGLFAFVRQHPWPAAFACMALVAGWQWSDKRQALTLRDSARAALATAQADRKADAAAWQRQVATARAATKAAERKSQEIASHAQTTRDALAADNAGLRAYIAARRLRAEGSGSATAVAADDLGATVPADTAAGTLVATDEADLDTCDRAYVYAAGAYEWAKGLVTGRLATPAK